MEDAAGRRTRTLLNARSSTVVVAGAGAALGAVTLFFGLGSFGLLGPDEPRYAAIAAAMARSGDWITPRLWGAPWFEKPVLYYWLAGFSLKLQGAGAAASRLPNALLAAAMVLGMALFLGRVHSPRAGALAGFLGLTSAFVMAFGRAATTDMTLTAPLALGLMAGYLWIESRRPAWLNAAAVLLALATLAKGPVALVLPGLTLLGFAASQRHGRWLRELVQLPAILLYLAITLPWYIAVERANPSFFRVFFLQHNLERFATNRFDHPQPAWFYLPVLLLALFPWSGWLGLPLARAVRRWRRLGWRGWGAASDCPLLAFLTAWTLAPLLFFSISQSKLPGYILPAVPGAIALIAVTAAESWQKLPRWPLALSAALAGLIPAGLWLTPAVLAAGGRLRLADLAHSATALELAAATVVLLLLLALRRRGLALVAATCGLMAGAVLLLTAPPLAPALDAALSARPLARQLEAQCQGGLPSACGSIPLYAWQLNRNTLYGLQYSLHAVLPEWPASGSGNAGIVLINRRDAAAFQASFSRTWDMGVLSRLLPPAAPGLTPWLAVRVQRR